LFKKPRFTVAQLVVTAAGISFILINIMLLPTASAVATLDASDSVLQVKGLC